MKVYFTAPLYEKEKNLAYYEAIIKGIEQHGHRVLQDTLDYSADEILSSSDEFQTNYYKTVWNKYLKEMDLCVAEISFPSTVNIGFEVASLLNAGKPVIALFRKDRDPRFISPEFSNKMIKVEYDLENINKVLGWALEEASSWLLRRFTFFIPSDIDQHLDNIFKNTGKTRSEYIRELIQKDRDKK